MHTLLGAGVATALLSVTAFAPQASARSIRFDGGLWFTGDRFVSRTMIASDGVLHEAKDNAAADSIVDLKGLYIVPPLADAHTHAVADSPDLAADIARFVRAGILYAKNPNSTWEGVARGRHALSNTTPAALRVLYSGSGFTSSGGHPSQIYEAHQTAGSSPQGWIPVDSVEELDDAWPKLAEAQADFVKIYLETSEEHERRKNDPAFKGKRGLDPKIVPHIVQRAHQSNLRVSAHVRTAADFHVAVESGVDEINHLPLERISPSDAKTCADRKVTIVTTVLSHRPTDGITDLNSVHRANLTLLRDADVHVALGTDNMHVDVVDELLAVKALGVFDPKALVQLATTGTIRAATHSSSPDMGTLTKGAEATFLTLRRDPLLDPSAFREIAHRFVRGELIPEPAEVVQKPTLAEELLQIVMHENVDAAIAKYSEWRRDRPHDFDFGEPQLNAVGYALLRHDRTDDAVRFLAFNAEQFPHSPNAWDSLSEAQLAAGDKAAAKNSARRVLELLPEAQGYPEKLRSQLEATARQRLEED
jgi:imidazolonepropionase-like amidohydrolase